MAYIDGNYVNAYLTEKVIGYPLNVPNNGGTREYTLTYVRNANSYADGAIGDTDGNAPSAYLVEQGPVQRAGAGVVRYTRTFCEIPTTWTEKEQVAYTFPGLTSGVNATWQAYGSRQPITLFAIATVTHSYSQGAAPNPDATFQVTDDSNVVDYIGTGNPAFASLFTDPAVEPSTYTISSEVRQFRGDIWEKITKVVPRPV